MSDKANPKFFDIHCHILPNLDDGARSMEQTIAMMNIAVDEGITSMICTPHYHLGRVVAEYNDCEERIKEVREELKKRNINVDLYLGAEICYFSEAVDEVDEGRIHTMAGSSYVLLEFEPSVEYRRIRTAVNEFTMAGYVPIIAHIERYDCMIMAMDEVSELISMGALIQINASSVLGELGFGVKRFIKKMMKNEMVSFVSTDAHSNGHRAPRMRKCYEYVAKKFGGDYAMDIFCNNAKNIVALL